MKYLVLPVLLAFAALAGCGRGPGDIPTPRPSTTTPAATPSAGPGATADPTNRHPAENVKPADSIGKSGTVSGMPENGSDASPPTVGDKPADPEKQKR